MTKTIALASVAGFVLLTAASPTLAQSTSTAPDQTAGPETSTVDDIVVTANKREERLQDVPLSVTVVGGEQLDRQNVVQLTDLVRSSPTLNVAGFQGALSIRGIGGGTFSRSAESSVGVVVDGVSLGNASQFPPPLFDAARVEVLDGPQGTLFGRNASAGILNVVTNAPDFSGPEVILHGDAATRDNYIARATVNLPVADNAALRVSGVFNQAPTTMTNRFDGAERRDKTQSVRGRFLWEPTSDVTVNLIADYGLNTSEGGSILVVTQAMPGRFLASRLAACGVTVGPENQDTCVDGGYDIQTETLGASAQVDVALGDLTLTSITAYRGLRYDQNAQDSDSVPINRLNRNFGFQDTDNLSQELRLSSPTGGRLDYVAGLYYFNSESSSSNEQIGPILADLAAVGACPLVPAVICTLPLGQRRAAEYTTESYAAFGQATYRLTDALRVVAGARIGHEELSIISRGSVATGAVAPVASVATADENVTDTYFSYRIGLQYDLTPDVMAYATYTKGYKGAAVNDANPTPNFSSVVRPEIPHNAEVGIKATLYNGRLGANLALYRNVVDDFQSQFFEASIPAFVFGNAPELTSQGVSASLFGSPLDGLTLNAGLLYNDATYGAGYRVACYQLQTAAQGCVGGSASAEGNRLVGAPEWKATLGAEYARGVGNQLEAFVSGDVVYTSDISFDAAGDPGLVSDAATIVSLRVGLRTEDRRYGVSVFARNLFDEYRPVLMTATPAAQFQLDTRSISSLPGPDSRRVVGLSFDARF